MRLKTSTPIDRRVVIDLPKSPCRTIFPSHMTVLHIDGLVQSEFLFQGCPDGWIVRLRLACERVNHIPRQHMHKGKDDDRHQQQHGNQLHRDGRR